VDDAAPFGHLCHDSQRRTQAVAIAGRCPG